MLTYFLSPVFSSGFERLRNATVGDFVRLTDEEKVKKNLSKQG